MEIFPTYPHIPHICTYSSIYAQIYSVGAIWRNCMANPTQSGVAWSDLLVSQAPSSKFYCSLWSWRLKEFPYVTMNLFEHLSHSLQTVSSSCKLCQNWPKQICLLWISDKHKILVYGYSMSCFSCSVLYINHLLATQLWNALLTCLFDQSKLPNAFLLCFQSLIITQGAPG